jgi:TRAP-type mannitol/chloroaromatic compound transport system permease small subunit
MPQSILRFSALIDRLNTSIGRFVGWLTLLMIGLGAFNAIARYLDRYLEIQAASNAYIEAQWYLFSLVFLLGSAHTLRQDKHVRVDVFYGRLSVRGKAWVDLVGGLVFLVPFCLCGLWVSFPTVMNSIEIRELSPDPGGLPRYPIKAMILVCFALLLLQAMSEMIKKLQIICSETGEAG